MPTRPPTTPEDAIRIAATDNGPEPRLAGRDVSVADLVQSAYDLGLAQAAALAGSDTAARAAIDYCAERRCDAAAARCRTCTLWMEQQGIESLDALCARFPEIRFTKGGAVLKTDPPPATTASAATDSVAPPLQWPGSLAEFARSWAGEEYWFIARRVLRRVKHKKARDGKLDLGKSESGPVAGSADAGPVFILVEPQMADNIGMVARAMANFAIDDLRLVAPRDGWPNDKARFAASGAHPVIDAAQAFATTNAAVADLTWVCATTARPRQLTKPVLTPDQAVAEMIRRMAAGERCGVLFGPERTGLTTDDVADADAMVMVRVNPTFASLNLAQSVLLLGYEWLKQTQGGAIGRHTDREGVEATGLQTLSPPASKAHLLDFFEHLESELTASGHFKPPEKRQTMVRNLRGMFERMGATEQEVRTLRGIIVSLTRSRNTGGDV